MSDDLHIDDLTRWTDWGGHWRVVEVCDRRVVVDLCACTGETMQRASSADPALIAYVQAAPPEPTGP